MSRAKTQNTQRRMTIRTINLKLVLFTHWHRLCAGLFSRLCEFVMCLPKSVGEIEPVCGGSSGTRCHFDKFVLRLRELTVERIEQQLSHAPAPVVASHDHLLYLVHRAHVVQQGLSVAAQEAGNFTVPGCHKVDIESRFQIVNIVLPEQCRVDVGHGGGS